MDLITNSLSVFRSPALSSNLFGLNYKQFKRTYPGNYSFNFAVGLSAYKDFSVKNYTNFYLTERMKMSQIYDIADDKVKIDSIKTPIIYGTSDYLHFNKKNNNYGEPSFTSSLSSSFNFVVFDNNRCNIYFVDNYKKFYLVCDSNNTLLFVKERYLSFSESTINPQDFMYLFSTDEEKILLFKQTPLSSLFITKQGNSLVATPLIESIDQVPTYTSQAFSIGRNLYFDPSQTLDFAFITYSEDNYLDEDRCLFGLRNNYLLHKKYSPKYVNTDLIVLKNQLLVDDVFGSSNNLLSGGDLQLYVDDLREYSSIFDDIKEETTNELELNYVFYNQSYRIEPGTNEFTSPSSMYPFARLNINDSKFIPSGAFGHTTPEFSDRIYHVSKEPQNAANGQYLLCTWLSGSGLSDHKVWVDRYYYPNLIEEAAAIAAKPYQYPTYEDFIENLIQTNTLLQNTIGKQKIFDKKSDFVFEPNERYIYERISQSLFSTASVSAFNGCAVTTSTSPLNYFKDLNEAGRFTFSFYFKGDLNEWEIFSDRNAIDVGVDIIKNSTEIILKYSLFDATETSETFTVNEITIPFKQLKENFVCISVDSVAGTGYFCVNNKIVLTFTIPRYEFTNKRLLYGDFFINTLNSRYSILGYDGVVYRATISPEFTSPELSFTIPLIDGKVPIDDLYITLPCGMRNGSDNITLLQHLCDSSAFKSNNINILVKNLNITNQNVLDGITQTIVSSINDFIPANSQVNNISFTNYK